MVGSWALRGCPPSSTLSPTCRSPSSRVAVYVGRRAAGPSELEEDSGHKVYVLHCKVYPVYSAKGVAGAAAHTALPHDSTPYSRCQSGRNISVQRLRVARRPPTTLKYPRWTPRRSARGPHTPRCADAVELWGICRGVLSTARVSGTGSYWYWSLGLKPTFRSRSCPKPGYFSRRLQRTLP